MIKSTIPDRFLNGLSSWAPCLLSSSSRDISTRLTAEACNSPLSMVKRARSSNTFGLCTTRYTAIGISIRLPDKTREASTVCYARASGEHRLLASTIIHIVELIDYTLFRISYASLSIFIILVRVSSIRCDGCRQAINSRQEYTRNGIPSLTSVSTSTLEQYTMHMYNFKVPHCKNKLRILSTKPRNSLL